jgi:hypothetical protein
MLTTMLSNPLLTHFAAIISFVMWAPTLVKYVRNVVWGAGIFLTGLLGVYRTVPARSYGYNALRGLDCFANAIAGGDPRETISSRSGKARAEGLAWGCIMCAFLGWAATKILGRPTDHCAESVNPTVGSDAVIPD